MPLPRRRSCRPREIPACRRRRRRRSRLPVHFDTNRRPAARHGRHRFARRSRAADATSSPGRPQPVGHVNPHVVDPLAGASVGSSSAVGTAQGVHRWHAGGPELPRGPARHDRRPRPHPLRPVGQPALRDLHGDEERRHDHRVQPRARVPEERERRVAGLRRAVRDLQRRRPDRAVRPARRPLDPHAVRRLGDALHAVRGGLDVSADPTGTYNRYAYSYGTDFNDYPKMGVWPDGYYITYNMFRRGRTFSGSKVCAFERDKMLAGAVGAAGLRADQQQLRQPAARRPRRHDAAAGRVAQLPAQHHVERRCSSGSSAVNWTRRHGHADRADHRAGRRRVQPGLQRRHLHPAAGHHAEARLAGRPPDVPPELPQPRRRAKSLLVNHSVASGGVHGHPLVRAEHRRRHRRPSRQQGTYQPDADYRWMGSAAMDKTGGIAIGYNVSNATTIKPSIWYAYRGADRPARHARATRPRSLDRSGRRRPATTSRAGATTARSASTRSTAARWSSRPSTSRPTDLQLGHRHPVAEAEHLPVGAARCLERGVNVARRSHPVRSS